jgi:hypothetical protein
MVAPVRRAMRRACRSSCSPNAERRAPGGEPAQRGLDTDDALLDPRPRRVAGQRDLLEAAQQRRLVGVDRERLLRVGGLEVRALELGDQLALEVSHRPGDAGDHVARALRLAAPLAGPGQALADLDAVPLGSDAGLGGLGKPAVGELRVGQRLLLWNAGALGADRRTGGLQLRVVGEQARDQLGELRVGGVERLGGNERLGLGRHRRGLRSWADGERAEQGHAA